MRTIHAHTIEKKRLRLVEMPIEFSQEKVIVIHRCRIRCFEILGHSRGLVGETKAQNVLEPIGLNSG